MAGVCFRHAGIVVRDMRRSLEFYRDRLGLKVISERREFGSYIDRLLGLSGVEVWWVKLGASEDKISVELLQYLSRHGAAGVPRQVCELGCSHVALTVSDLDRLYDELRSAGVVFTTEPLPSPEGTVKVTLCFDPDGTPIELVQPLV